MNNSSWKKNGENAIYREMAIILEDLRNYFLFLWINNDIDKNAIYREMAIILEDLRIDCLSYE